MVVSVSKCGTAHPSRSSFFLVGLVVGRSDRAAPISSVVAWSVDLIGRGTVRAAASCFAPEQGPHVGDVVL
ncbi:MAG: hypothetical protein ACAH79_03300, partial [Thermoleophilia bacterium]